MLATVMPPFWQTPAGALLCYLLVASAVAYPLVAAVRDRHAPRVGEPPRRRAPSGPRVLLLAWLPLAVAALLAGLEPAHMPQSARQREAALILAVIAAAIVGVCRGWGWMLPCALWGFCFGLVSAPRLGDSGVISLSVINAGVAGVAGAVIGAMMDVAAAELRVESERRSRRDGRV